MNTSPQIKLCCIIDDDDIYINLLKKIIVIKNLSEKILVFKDGEAALAYFTSILNSTDEGAFPEIIFLDLNMPVMNGWIFLKKFVLLKSEKLSAAHLYVASSSIDPYDIERAESHSLVTDYLINPVSLDTFAQLFKRASAPLK